MLDKKRKNWIAINKIIKGKHVFDLEVTSINLYYFNERQYEYQS